MRAMIYAADYLMMRCKMMLCRKDARAPMPMPMLPMRQSALITLPADAAMLARPLRAIIADDAAMRC